MNIRNVSDVKIKTKLMAIYILLVAISVIVLGYVSYNTAKDGMNDESEVMPQQQALIVKGAVTSVLEERASTAEGSSSSVQEQTSAIQELTAEVPGLSDIANELADELNRFKVN
ncbi:MAG: hypothetical protein ACXQTY_01785 [Candidatus Methanogasteraceae archaeon]